jgi:hypothetical protein
VQNPDREGVHPRNTRFSRTVRGHSSLPIGTQTETTMLYFIAAPTPGNSCRVQFDLGLDLPTCS